MKTHIGVVLVSVSGKPWSRARVLIDFLDGYVVVWSVDGKWLGSWPARDVSADTEWASRVMLTLGTERIPLEIADIESFSAALEDQVEQFMRMRRLERLKKALVMHTLPLLGRYALMRLGVVFDWNMSKAGGEQSPAAASGPTRSEADSHGEAIGEVAMNTLSEKELLLRSVMESAQEDVVDAVHLGMEAWFGFYLRTAKGTGRDRMDWAITGLRDASLRLRDIALQVSVEAEPDEPGQKHVVDTYRKAVEDWAEAFDLMARGVELDQQHLSQAGIDLLVTAAEAAWDIIMAGESRATTRLLSTLEYLEALDPPVKVSRQAVRRAKEPWKTTVIAAGAPLRWPDSIDG